MEIREEHVDYWVVYRLRELLLSTPETMLEVSRSYSLFGTILCWTLQHIRIQRGDFSRPGDELASELLKSLKAQSAFDLPWRCKINVEYNPGRDQILLHSKEERKDLLDLSTTGEDFNLSAFGLLKMMRNALAHGDGRKVYPLNEQKRDPKRQLFGFRLKLEWKRSRKFGSVELRLPDFHRIGGAIAQLYCDKLEIAMHNNHLKDEALQNISERPAA